MNYVFEDPQRRKYVIRLWEGEGVANLPEPEWLIRNFVQKGGLTVVYGPPGSGKSLAMLDWAQHIETGEYWHGRHATSYGRALYVLAEGQFGLKGRLEAWKAHYGKDILPPVRYHIEGVSFWAKEGAENAGADAIVAAAAALDVDVVFIDTMAATFGGGDENRQQDMNLYLRPLRELRQMGIAVVIAHHANRSEGLVRGSSVLTGEADTIIEMRPTVDKDNPGRVLWTTVVCRKQKDYIPFPPFRLNLKSVELEPSSSGRERSGPVFELPLDTYEGPVSSAGRRLEVSGRRKAIIEQILVAVSKEPYPSWRTIITQVKGRLEEKTAVRDMLIAEKILEYDEAEGGYFLGEVPFETSEVSEEIPPMLGYHVEEE